MIGEEREMSPETMGPEGAKKEPEDEGPIGIFPSWSSLYTAVVVFGVLVISVLTLLTGLLDFGAGP